MLSISFDKKIPHTYEAWFNSSLNKLWENLCINYNVTAKPYPQEQIND